MSASRLRGDRPRPRALLLGWEGHTAHELRALFPSAHSFEWFSEAEGKIHPSELDVVVCSANSHVPHAWSEKLHSVVFGRNHYRGLHPVPGTTEHSAFRLMEEKCESELHEAMEVPTILRGPLERWLQVLEDPRGLPVIGETWSGREDNDRPKGTKTRAAALVMAKVPEAPLAVQFFNPKRKRGAAWFPSDVPNVVDWVRALLHLWAPFDPTGLPGLRDWQTHPDWLTSAEGRLLQQVRDLEVERATAIAAFDLRAADLQVQVVAARDEGNRGARAILTTKDDDLVAAVAGVLRDLGFEIDDMDKLRGPKSKREDLRLRTSLRPGWEAIAEVKGSDKSGGRLTDLAQLAEHVTYYVEEKGKRPDNRLYIINGEIERVASPSLRMIPFTEEDVEPFSKVNGLVVPTPELFRLHRAVQSGALDGAEAQRQLIESTGIFRYPGG